MYANMIRRLCHTDSFQTPGQHVEEFFFQHIKCPNTIVWGHGIYFYNQAAEDIIWLAIFYCLISVLLISMQGLCKGGRIGVNITDAFFKNRQLHQHCNGK